MNLKVEEKEKPKSMTQVYEEANRAIDEFMFLIFIPNPATRRVKVIVDDGFTTLTLKIDDFVDKIEKLCGFEESGKIRFYCKDYGDIYLYDREKRTINQVQERADRKIELSDYLVEKRKEENKPKAPVITNTFEISNKESIYEKIANAASNLIKRK